MGDKSRHGKLEENVTRDSGKMRDGARTEAGVEIELRQGKVRKKSSIQKFLIPEHGIVGIQLRRGRCDDGQRGCELCSLVTNTSLRISVRKDKSKTRDVKKTTFSLEDNLTI